VDVAQSRLAGEHHKAECARLQGEVERLTTSLETERGGRHEAEVKAAAATASAEGLVQRMGDYEKRIAALESALAEARKTAADSEKEVVRLTGELAACTARLSRPAPGPGTARK
jgi:chromosome segregation ATPase